MNVGADITISVEEKSISFSLNRIQKVLLVTK